MRRFFARLATFFRGNRAEQELAREVMSHLVLLQEEYQRAGMLPEDARLAARRAIGGVEQAKERQRDTRSFVWLEDLRRDLRHTLRSLRRSPGFTVSAILTLALGIGANTAIFSVLNAVLLRPLPVTSPEQLVVIEPINEREGKPQNLSYPLFEAVRQVDGVFAGVLAALDGTVEMDVADPDLGSPPMVAEVQGVSGEYFTVLGVRPALGRLLTVDDNRGPDGRAVVVLNYGFWTRRFGSEPSVIGRRLLVKGQPVTVVGVTPATFFGESVGRAPDLWTPLAAYSRFPGGSGRPQLDDPRPGWLRAMARLSPGSTKEQAEAALAVMLARVQAGADERAKLAGYFASMRVSDGARGPSDFRQQFTVPLQILAGIVGLILLIACANVGNLLLARASARQRELAVRLAIGAGRRRLVRQLLTESMVLAAAGGVVALLLASVGSRLLVVLASTDDVPVLLDVALNASVVAFTAITSLTAVLVFGLAPAVVASKIDVEMALKASVGRYRRARLPRLLIVSQVALSLLLLTGASLFVQTLRNLRERNLGFTADSLLQIGITSPEAVGYTRQQTPPLTRRILERLAAAPGVQSATVAHFGFATGWARTCCIAVEGHEPDRVESRRSVETAGVAPGYFGVMQLPLVAGRDFEMEDVVGDRDNGPRNIIVNEAFVRRHITRGAPIGRRIGWGNPPRGAYQFTVVGVARDAIYQDPRLDAEPLMYSASFDGTLFTVRLAAAPTAVVPVIRREIQAVDRNLEVRIDGVSDAVERAVSRERLLARLSAFFGLLAAALAAIGVYGVMAYAVIQRTKELGIRLALGAQSASVLRMEIRSALRLAAMGIAVGVPAAVIAGRAIGSQLFGISPDDPATIGGVAIVLALVAAAAAYVPARRAARVDPMVALRHE